jgi:hypothetical protein
LCTLNPARNSRRSGNKKERVPEGPLSKPFRSTERYEVSIRSYP